MNEELSIEELLGFYEENHLEKEDFFEELETVLESETEDFFQLEVQKSNTNDLLKAFSDTTIEELLEEMDHPKGKFIHTSIKEDKVENLEDLKAFMENAKKQRNQ